MILRENTQNRPDELTPAQRERAARKAAYLKKLQGLLKSATALDKKAMKGTRELALRMQDAVLARTAEAAARADRGLEPKWGAYWAPKLSDAVGKVVRELAQRFDQDLQGWQRDSFDLGLKVADTGIEATHPGLLLTVPEIDPSAVLIGGGFKAELITQMEKKQIADLSKIITTSVALGEPPAKLMAKLATKIDAGPWRTVELRAEVIARTEISRVQNLAATHRMQQVQRTTGTTQYVQWLVAYVNGWPCSECAPNEDRIWTLDGVAVRPADGKPIPALPCHPNCRCTLVPYMPEYEEDGELVDDPQPLELRLPEDDEEQGLPELPPAPPPPDWKDAVRALPKPTNPTEARHLGHLVRQEIDTRWEAAGLDEAGLEKRREAYRALMRELTVAGEAYKEANDRYSDFMDTWRTSPEGQAVQQRHKAVTESIYDRQSRKPYPEGEEEKELEARLQQAHTERQAARDAAAASQLQAIEAAKKRLDDITDAMRESERKGRAVWKDRAKITRDTLAELRSFGVAGGSRPTWRGPRKLQAEMEKTLEWFPESWLASIRGTVELREIKRGQYDDSRSILWLSKNRPVDYTLRVSCHELGHRCEHRVPELKRICLEYLRERAAGATTERLKDLYPRSNYEAWERTWKDRFVDAYWGKDYSGRATEILSMGMEALFHPYEPHCQKPWTEDPEMIDFMLGMVAAL